MVVRWRDKRVESIYISMNWEEQQKVQEVKRGVCDTRCEEDVMKEGTRGRIRIG